MKTTDIKETENTVNETENTNIEEVSTENVEEKPVDGEETNIVDNEITEDKSIEINNEEEKGLLEDMEEPNESRDRLISTIILCGLCAILTAIITTLVVSSHSTVKEMNTEVKYKVGTEDSNVFVEQAMYNIANDLEIIEKFTFYERYIYQVGTNTPLQKEFTGTLVQKPNIVERYGYVVDDYDVQYSEDAKNFKNSDETDLLQVMFNEESIQNVRKIAAGYEVEIKTIIDNKPFEGSYTLISDNENTIGRIVGHLYFYAKSPETDYSVPGGNKDVSEDYYIELITNKYKEIYNAELPSVDVEKTAEIVEEQTDEQSKESEESEVDADEHAVVGTLHITDREYIGGVAGTDYMELNSTYVDVKESSLLYSNKTYDIEIVTDKVNEETGEMVVYWYKPEPYELNGVSSEDYLAEECTLNKGDKLTIFFADNTTGIEVTMEYTD